MMDEIDLLTQKYIDSLPDDIEYLHLTRRGIQNLPDMSRFTKLYELDVSKNMLTTLPPLPRSIERLSCGYNRITRLSPLNGNLTFLDCSGNLLCTLPEMPPDLFTLVCRENRLESVPAFGPSLHSIDCNKNRIRRLPDLNHCLENLSCENNCIMYLPKINNNLRSLRCNNNPFRAQHPFLEVHPLIHHYYPYETPVRIRYIKVLETFRRTFYAAKFRSFCKRWFYYTLRAKMSRRKRDLLETSSRIALSPNRIRRLLENGDITLDLIDHQAFDDL